MKAALELHDLCLVPGHRKRHLASAESEPVLQRGVLVAIAALAQIDS